MKKIVVASLRQETNSFSPVITVAEDFIVYKGADMLEHIAVASLFKEAGVDVIPTLLAYALPSGKVDRKCYEDFKKQILDKIPADDAVDGIWLYLHGAMDVVDIGSGEADLVAAIRKKAGQNVVIAAALDFHANNSQKLVSFADIICGYRTVPHEDSIQTQLRSGKILLSCLFEDKMPETVMISLPLLFPGEMVMTDVEPAKSLMMELEDIENKKEMLCMSVFSGMPWSDTINTGASVIVTGIKNDPEIRMLARKLALSFWEKRRGFQLGQESADTKKAVSEAMSSNVWPVFISDSGDNVTAGAPGDNAYLLSLLIANGVKDVLVAGIVDADLIKKCEILNKGQETEVHIGGLTDKNSLRINIKAVLVKKGDLFGGIRFCLLNSNGIDIIVTEKRYAFTSEEKITVAGVELNRYRIVVLKLGYLFPDLKKISKRSIMAMTPGCSCLMLDGFDYKSIKRPMYPLDADFEIDLEDI